MSSMSATMSCMGARPLGLPLVITRRGALQRQASRVRSTPSIAETCAAMAGHCQPALYRNSIALIAARLQAVYLVVMAIIPPPRQRRPGRCLSVSSGRHIRNSLRRSTPGLCRTPPSAPHKAPAPLRAAEPTQPPARGFESLPCTPVVRPLGVLLGLASEMLSPASKFVSASIAPGNSRLDDFRLPQQLMAGERGGGRVTHVPLVAALFVFVRAFVSAPALCAGDDAGLPTRPLAFNLCFASAEWAWLQLDHPFLPASAASSAWRRSLAANSSNASG